MNQTHIGEHDLKTSDGGRGYIAEFFAKRLRRHDFQRYIKQRLAADFACVLAKHLSERDTAAPTFPSDAAQAPMRHFVYDNDCGYEEFDTDEARDKAHQAAIDGYLDDGWSEEVTSVVSGIVTHRTVQTNVEHRPPRCTEHPEQDNDDCDVCLAWGEFPNHDFDICCRYEPEQIAAAPAVPAAAAPRNETLPFESALFELINKIDSNLDTGDMLEDAKRASAALDAILSKGDLVANAHDYFRDSQDRYEKSIEFRIGWNACLDALVNARAVAPTPTVAADAAALAKCAYNDKACELRCMGQAGGECKAAP